MSLPAQFIGSDEHEVYEALLGMSEAQLTTLAANPGIRAYVQQVISRRMTYNQPWVGKGVPTKKKSKPVPLTKSQKEYGKYLRSAHWRAFRKLAITAAQGKCKRCGSQEQLNVHHRHYRSLGREVLEDVEVYCDSCHKAEHQLEPEDV